MIALIIKEFKLRVKERKTYMMMFIMPMVFILLIGSSTMTKTASALKGTAQSSAVSQIVTGYTVMFAFSIITVMGQAFFKDKESGMLSRLMATPIEKYSYMIGMWVPNFIVVLAQVTALYTFGHLYFKMSLGNMPALITVTLLLAFVGTALGLLISFISENQQTVTLFMQLVVIGGSAFGGLLFSTDKLPQSMQKLPMIFPQYWIQKSYVAILGLGGGFRDIWTNIVVLFSMGVIFFILAYFRYNKFYDKATS